MIFKTCINLTVKCFKYHTIIFLHVECRDGVVETPILLWRQYFLTCGELDIDFYFVLQYNKKRNFKGD